MKESICQPASPFRLGVLILLVAFACAVLVWRAVDLHVFNTAFLKNQGDARALRVEPIVAHRGMISDRHGEPVAISTPVDSVWIHPETYAREQQDLSPLAKLLQLNVSDLKNKIRARQGKEFVYIKRRINPELAEQVMALEIPGVSLQREYRRYYPMGEVGAHVLGFNNVDDVGQEGLELAYNDWLQGSSGSQRVIKDRLGRVINHVELIEPVSPGKPLTLSLDRRLQYLAYRELKQAVFMNRAKSGSAIILDSKSGEILAMVNQPSYNPNNRANLKGSRYRNRAVTDIFEPGSSIKPFTVAAALESGLFSTRSLIDTAPGIYRVGRNTIRDFRNYGEINLATVIQKSSNVGATKMALAIPSERLWRVISGVGFGVETGSGYPGEVEGVLTHSSEWRRIDQATLAFGYGMSVTPLQLARAYAVLANDGVLLPVTFLKRTTAIRGERVLKSKTVKQVRSMLEAVVSAEGTGFKAHIAGYRVAGKTGTSKKISKDGGYAEDRYISVFAGMAPASDPRLVMVVMINEPRAKFYYGGEVAAPVFGKVMAGALRLMGIAPDKMDENSVQMAAIGKNK